MGPEGPGPPGWGGPAGPGPPGWGGPAPPGWGPPVPLGPAGFFGGFCDIIASCLSCLCCCWLIRDCFGGLYGPPGQPGPLGP